MVTATELSAILAKCPREASKTLFFPVLFLGNGINRLSASVSWESLLASQLTSADGSHLVGQRGIPFTLVYEELLARATLTNKQPHLRANRQIAAIIRSLQPNDFHAKVMRLPNVGTIITTNYDFCLEESVGAQVTFDTRVREARYNLFRRSSALDKDVWHIHGRHDQPGTITLGFDHYAGYLQKLRNYATSGFSSKDHGKLRSPLASGRRYFEFGDMPFSWLDVFLRHDVHVIGFGFDYSELDIWWALVLKHQIRHRTRMRPIKGQVGTTSFYYPRFRTETDTAFRSKLSLLASFGVEVVPVDVPNGAYSDFYDYVIQLISEVPKYRWADVPPSDKKSFEDYTDQELSDWHREWDARKAQLDLNLPSVRASRKNSLRERDI